jgi:hypothetical protein
MSLDLLFLVGLLGFLGVWAMVGQIVVRSR